MNPRMLLRLYPRAWRDRYGEELLEMIGDRPLTLAQSIDLVAGAVDARFTHPAFFSSPAVTPATAGAPARGVLCWRKQPAYTTADGLVSAAIIVAGSFVALFLSSLLKDVGSLDAAKFVKNAAFPVSLMLSTNFTFFKGVSLRARVVILGSTILLLLAISALAVWR